MPPTAKRWTFPSSLADNATLRLSYGMVLCFNVANLLMAFAISLLAFGAIVAAIYTLPLPAAHNLDAATGGCNSPAFVDAYRVTSFEMGQFVASNAPWCNAQIDGCSVLGEIISRVLKQADPARSIGATERTVVPCRAESCAHFDDDAPDVLPRCITNASRTGWCPEVLLLIRNASVAGVGALPPCVMDVLVECNQQAIVAALDWVPNGHLVPPLTCARQVADNLLTTFSWREPCETLQYCVRLMLSTLVFYFALIFTVLLLKKLTLGRFRSGVWDLWDVQSKEWIRQAVGYLLKFIVDSEFTMSKALNGSQLRVVLYRLFGMRVGKHVFLDRDVVIMGARSDLHMHAHLLSNLLPSSHVLSCVAQMRISSC